MFISSPNTTPPPVPRTEQNSLVRMSLTKGHCRGDGDMSVLRTRAELHSSFPFDVKRTETRALTSSVSGQAPEDDFLGTGPLDALGSDVTPCGPGFDLDL